MNENKKKITVVALGGNAILRPDLEGTAEEQFSSINRTTKQLGAMIFSGKYKLVISHGNGPQVGNILLQNDIAKEEVPALPLDICGAESQGLIGYMLTQSLKNVLSENDRGDIPVATVLTQTIVDDSDPAFNHPTKPVGPFYSESEAKKLERERGYKMIEDAGRGYRRVVPSPEPVAINERDPIRQLLDAHTVVIASGGGGIPVVKRDGQLQGREAVIDKDLASERLAEDVGAKILLILTDVDYVYLNYGTPNERPLKEITVDEAKRYMNEGHFAQGSMKPKVKAGIQFIEAGGQKVIITSLNKGLVALEGLTGTQITKQAKPNN